MTKKTNVIFNSVADVVPPHTWFGISAVFHYLGPSFAVLLFPHIGVLGVIWLRLASASTIFCIFSNPYKTFIRASTKARLILIFLGISFVVMNTSFYFALDRLPMSLVAAIEFVGIIGVALYGLRSTRNYCALTLSILGVFILINVQVEFDEIGFFWAILNTIFFVLYIFLGHKAAEAGAGEGIEMLGSAMFIAFIVFLPFGLIQVLNIISVPELILAGIGIGISSSVIPYMCDQIAMSRLPRATFALLLSLLPAMAVIIAAIVLAQIPTVQDIVGVFLVMLGIAVHKPNNDSSY